MNANQDHAHRLREMRAALYADADPPRKPRFETSFADALLNAGAPKQSSLATFGKAYEAALVAGLEALLLNERDTQMDTANNPTHARMIRQVLDDVRAGRPLNTGGDVQAALEAAALQLEGGGATNANVTNTVANAPATREVRAGDEQNPPNRVHPPVEQAVGHAPGVTPAVGTVTTHVSNTEATPAHVAESAKSPARHK